jgi:hypothetical protein
MRRPKEAFVMITKQELLALRNRILPPGATKIIELLAEHHMHLEMTGIVLEHVPLLIIGRHGMIARIPVNGRIVKISEPNEIYRGLQAFFENKSTLYVFINLPAIRFPSEVQEVIEEVAERIRRKEALYQEIDRALEAKDRSRFHELVIQLKQLETQDPPSRKQGA